MSASEIVWSSLGKRQYGYYLLLRAERAAWFRRTREALWGYYGGKCALCPRELRVSHITIDHICPKRRGGTDEMHNLRPLCKKCHRDLNSHDQCLGSLLISRMEVANHGA